MKADWNEKEEKVLAELDELKYTGGWHKIRIEVLKKYAAEVSRERINDAWLRGFNEGRLAHPRKERKEKKCTCGGYPDCICKEQEEQC